MTSARASSPRSPGYDKVAFPGDYGNINTYFWIPIIGPFVGGLLGAFIYDFFIHNTYKALGKAPSPTLEEMGVTVEDLGGYIATGGGGTTPESHGRTVEER